MNTAIGANALWENTTGNRNSGLGAFALAYNTTGQYNTAAGFYALAYNTTGTNNTALGNDALYGNTTGGQNIGIGEGAGQATTTGSNNISIGQASGIGDLAGNYNIAIGYETGIGNTVGSDNLYLGNFLGSAGESGTIRVGSPTENRTFIEGIRGIQTGLSNAVDVVIDGNGQLGTINSSSRFKRDVSDMGAASDGLLKLRPVTFHYKHASEDGHDRLEYGLIAEEVARVFPDAVVYTPSGEVETVQYYKINAMMLNEIQKQHKMIQDQAEELHSLRERLDVLERAVTSEERER